MPTNIMSKATVLFLCVAENLHFKQTVQLNSDQVGEDFLWSSLLRRSTEYFVRWRIFFKKKQKNNKFQ